MTLFSRCFSTVSSRSQTDGSRAFSHGHGSTIGSVERRVLEVQYLAAREFLPEEFFWLLTAMGPVAVQYLR